MTVTADVAARLRAAGCVFAEDEADLLVAQAASDGRPLDDLVTRRAAGEPLELVLGWADLAGVRVRVAAGVFVPRVRSELLAREAVSAARRAAAAGRAPVVVDLCCGTGVLGLVVAARVPGVVLHLADVDGAAVECARRNVADAGLPAQVHHGDLDGPLPDGLRGTVDVLVANVPYVPTGAVATLPAEARLFEHRVALDGGGDGLDVVRRVAAVSPHWLAPGGAVLVETTERQAPAAADAFAGQGLRPEVVQDDDLGATVVAGRSAG